MNFSFNITYSKYVAWVWYNLKRGPDVNKKQTLGLDIRLFRKKKVSGLLFTFIKIEEIYKNYMFWTILGDIWIGILENFQKINFSSIIGQKFLIPLKFDVNKKLDVIAQHL
jgi:hypothetical protein